MNATSPRKPQVETKQIQRDSIKNDLPDSDENDDEEGTNIGGANLSLPLQTAHFPSAPTIDVDSHDNLRTPQKSMDPIDMIT